MENMKILYLFNGEEKIISILDVLEGLIEKSVTSENFIGISSGCSDMDGDLICSGHYVQNEDTIFIVKYREDHTCFMLEPVSQVKYDGDKDAWLFMFVEHVGNGYSKRKDLKIVGSIKNPPEQIPTNKTDNETDSSK